MYHTAVYRKQKKIIKVIFVTKQHVNVLLTDVIFYEFRCFRRVTHRMSPSACKLTAVFSVNALKQRCRLANVYANQQIKY